MARRIRRRRRTSPSAPRAAEESRPAAGLPEARPLPESTVVIAAPGPLLTVLTSRISGSAEVRLAGVARDEATAVEKVVMEEADVAAVEINLGGPLNGLDIARSIKMASPGCGVLIMVSDMGGSDVHRHARRFGIAWSYAVTSNLESGHRFPEVVQGVARGIHWIDPELKRVLEAIWKVAAEGRDMEIQQAVEQLDSGERVDEDDLDDFDSDAPAPRGIQTMQAGRGGIGSGGFGVNKAG